MQPRIYTYKITFEEVPYYYYGSKKEKRYNEEYWGSPITNRWCWELYTPKKQILELFDYTDEGYEECLKIENRLIKPVLNDPWCLNERCGPLSSLNVLRQIGNRKVKDGVGIFALSSEELSELGKKGGSIGGPKGAKTQIENKIGIYARNEEQLRIDNAKGGKVTGKRHYQNKTGLFGMSEEDKRKAQTNGGKVVGNQRWKCLVTGKITNIGALTRYQKARGIDTSQRVRVG
jgi:hypothetical protein